MFGQREYTLPPCRAGPARARRDGQTGASPTEASTQREEAVNVDVFRGAARLKDAHTVSFLKPDGTEDDVTGDIILIATGSSPCRPAGIPFDNHRIYDSDSILRVKMIPKTMVVIGGGVLGCEYACTFSALGVQVTLVESSNRILRFVDSEIADRLRTRLELLGLRFVFDDRLQRAEVLPD